MVELGENQSGKAIANHCHISTTTLQRTLNALGDQAKPNLKWLPECLLFDEFRSLEDGHGKFSFSCMDGQTGKLFDIVPSRQKKDLIDYFMAFERKARQRVNYVVTDMNAPYYATIKACFPNAQLIVDRFHIVQHLNRCFDQLRRRVMKQLHKNQPEEAKKYRQLKSLSRLLLKNEDHLNYSDPHKWRNFDWNELTEKDVVHRLLTISPELRAGYIFYQQLLQAFQNKEIEAFFSLLKTMPLDIPKELHVLKGTFKTYQSGIEHAMRLPYSNAKLENLHTHIKNLKRTLYGFKSFRNMRTRIFLLNHLIEIK